MILPEVMRMKKTKKTLTQKQSFYALIAVIGILALGAFVTIDQVRNQAMRSSIEKIELAESNNVTEEHKKPVTTESEEQELSQPNESENKQTIENANVVGNSAVTLENEEKTKEEKVVKETKAAISYDGSTKLKWPLSGNVVLPYSMDSTIYFQTLDQYQCNPGMMIQATEGAEVKNIANGKVTKVDKTTKYGNTITLDIGNGYTVTYGQLQDITWKKGDVLDEEAVVGKVAPSTAFFTLEGNHLYFEMQKDKKPVDPMKYLQ